MAAPVCGGSPLSDILAAAGRERKSHPIAARGWKIAGRHEAAYHRIATRSDSARRKRGRPKRSLRVRRAAAPGYAAAADPSALGDDRPPVVELEEPVLRGT